MQLKQLLSWANIILQTMEEGIDDEEKLETFSARREKLNLAFEKLKELEREEYFLASKRLSVNREVNSALEDALHLIKYELSD